MRTLAIAGACVLGVIVIMAVTAAAGNGRDHTGEKVRVNTWAGDVCGTVGTWEGQLKDIRHRILFAFDAAEREAKETGKWTFQRGNLAPALTVAENAAVGLVLKATGREETASRVA